MRIMNALQSYLKTLLFLANAFFCQRFCKREENEFTYHTFSLRLINIVNRGSAFAGIAGGVYSLYHFCRTIFKMQLASLNSNTIFCQ